MTSELSRPSLVRSHLETLVKRLAEEPDAGIRDYESVRRQLVGFFERRGVHFADALADETIDRVARRLGEGETVLNLSGYFYGVARFVLLEWRRRQVQEQKALREHSLILVTADDDTDVGLRDQRLACLEKALDALPPESRSLLVRYHDVRLEARRQLADEMGITYTTLKTRAHRIRLTLAGWVGRCMDSEGL